MVRWQEGLLIATVILGLLTLAQRFNAITLYPQQRIILDQRSIDEIARQLNRLIEAPVPERQSKIPSVAPGPGQPQILARWVQLVPPPECLGQVKLGSGSDCAPQFLARAVFANRADCEGVAFRPGDDRVPLPMEMRANPNSASAFPVRLCEGLVDRSWLGVTFQDGTGISWERIERLDRIAILGDTGCDNDPAGDVRQDCVAKWPFADVALSAEESDPALVVHVGDYRYRHSDNEPSDNWENWKKDFFDPAKPLLSAAPWIMLRGNHENCFKRNGNGWYYLLEPRFREVTRCPHAPNREFDSQPPFAVDLDYDEGKLRLVAIELCGREVSLQGMGNGLHRKTAGGSRGHACGTPATSDLATDPLSGVGRFRAIP